MVSLSAGVEHYVNDFKIRTERRYIQRRMQDVEE
jgi:hypothetical protein